MQIFLHKFAICRIYNVLSKESPLRTFTRVEGRSCLVRRTNVTDRGRPLVKVKENRRLITSQRSLHTYINSVYTIDVCLCIFILLLQTLCKGTAFY